MKTRAARSRRRTNRRDARLLVDVFLPAEAVIGRKKATHNMRWHKDVYNAWIVGIIGVALGRLALIVQRPYAVFYNVLAVMLVGGLGMGLTLLLYSHGSARPQEVCLSILTYSLAIVGMSMLDAFWRQKPTRPIQILSVCIALAAVWPPLSAAWTFFGPSSVQAGAEVADPYSGNVLFSLVPLQLTSGRVLVVRQRRRPALRKRTRRGSGWESAAAPIGVTWLTTQSCDTLRSKYDSGSDPFGRCPCPLRSSSSTRCRIDSA